MYNYEVQKQSLFTEEGTSMLLAIRGNVDRLLNQSGAFKSTNAFVGGDGWMQLAALDYLVEQKHIREVTPKDVAGQDRVFVSA